MKAGKSEVHNAHFSVENQSIALWPQEPLPKPAPSVVLSRCLTGHGAVMCLALVLLASVVLPVLLHSWLQEKILDVKTNIQLLNSLVGNTSTSDSEIKRNRDGMEATDFQLRTVNASLNQMLSKILKMETSLSQINAQIHLLKASWEEVSTLNSPFSELRRNLENASALDARIHELQKNLEHISKMVKQQSDILQMVSQGWKNFQGNFYYFSRISKTWYSAQQYCRSTGSQLTSVTSDSEQEFLYRTARGIFYWIGLSKEGSKGPWVWADGTPFNKAQSSRYWIPGEPNNMGYIEHCVSLKTFAFQSWNDAYCNHTLQFICKQPYILSGA